MRGMVFLSPGILKSSINFSVLNQNTHKISSSFTSRNFSHTKKIVDQKSVIWDGVENKR